MKIVFTGGGTGGHFYPIIAIAEALKDVVKERKIIEPELFFFGPNVFDDRALFEQSITSVQTPAGKMRRYFSVLNFFDLFKTGWGILQTVWSLYKVYPDVVFSKGGYGSVPTVLAAKFLRIPLMIHDSDAIPGRATLMAATQARKIAIAYEEATEYFPTKVHEKIALVGNPVRKDVKTPARDGAFEYLKLENNVPVILILGGSLGSETINETVLSALPQLVSKYQVIHQTGRTQFEGVREAAKVILENNERRYRYKPFDYLSSIALKMAGGAADIVVSRAGSTSITEIALWGRAAILVPIPESVSRDQRLNAFSYGRSGAAIVIEQKNFTPNVMLSEIDRLFTNPKARNDMAEAALKFARPNAASDLANAILDTALEHET
jgi:UDP-N-acetylglucosamine--N-acetylmuramyl-(pentapeptide) pyrophosphoryl-undecaprenol N-acetylglucosamine transferase